MKTDLNKAIIDILVITYNRPVYTQLSLNRLFETCDERTRVWLWHNGTDQETLDVVKSFADNQRVYEFYHSRENKKLREPTNWFWSNATGDFLSKVDDDCLVPYGWIDALCGAHTDVPEFGVIGCWCFPDEDFIPALANKKIMGFGNGHQIMQNCWIGGTGYLMKRECLKANGLLQAGQSFTNYCIRLAAKGWVNGWYYPFLYQEHMDDPRSPNSCLQTDDDLKRYMPLSARVNGVETLRAWQKQLKRSAVLLQKASVDPENYIGWRLNLRRAKDRAKRLFRIKSKW